MPKQHQLSDYVCVSHFNLVSSHLFSKFLRSVEFFLHFVNVEDARKAHNLSNFTISIAKSIDDFSSWGQTLRNSLILFVIRYAVDSESVDCTKLKTGQLALLVSFRERVIGSIARCNKSKKSSKTEPPSEEKCCIEGCHNSLSTLNAWLEEPCSLHKIKNSSCSASCKLEQPVRFLKLRELREPLRSMYMELCFPDKVVEQCSKNNILFDEILSKSVVCSWHFHPFHQSFKYPFPILALRQKTHERIHQVAKKYDLQSLLTYSFYSLDISRVNDLTPTFTFKDIFEGETMKGCEISHPYFVPMGEEKEFLIFSDFVSFENHPAVSNQNTKVSPKSSVQNKSSEQVPGPSCTSKPDSIEGACFSDDAFEARVKEECPDSDDSCGSNYAVETIFNAPKDSLLEEQVGLAKFFPAIGMRLVVNRNAKGVKSSKTICCAVKSCEQESIVEKRFKDGAVPNFLVRLPANLLLALRWFYLSSNTLTDFAKHLFNLRNEMLHNSGIIFPTDEKGEKLIPKDVLESHYFHVCDRHFSLDYIKTVRPEMSLNVRCIPFDRISSFFTDAKERSVFGSVLETLREFGVSLSDFTYEQSEPRVCCVDSCNKRYDAKGSEKIRCLFPIPLHPEERIEWLRTYKTFHPEHDGDFKTSFVCDAHFEENVQDKTTQWTVPCHQFSEAASSYEPDVSSNVELLTPEFSASYDSSAVKSIPELRECIVRSCGSKHGDYDEENHLVRFIPLPGKAKRSKRKKILDVLHLNDEYFYRPDGTLLRWICSRHYPELDGGAIPTEKQQGLLLPSRHLGPPPESPRSPFWKEEAEDASPPSPHPDSTATPRNSSPEPAPIPPKKLKSDLEHDECCEKWRKVSEKMLSVYSKLLHVQMQLSLLNRGKCLQETSGFEGSQQNSKRMKLWDDETNDESSLFSSFATTSRFSESSFKSELFEDLDKVAKCGP
ncbi:unnamed protein product [Caenorhabditis auriculariae]|uniref:THAP-type domain-containing protein n=1 Tax=Caenorhabditis auriculariae TaxID=2777116 RepID=A0A8S1GTI5_9PELO|nr:unnamed protein product [Caenorhabditis auriculariae]